jgi:hypothetical protein
MKSNDSDLDRFSRDYRPVFLAYLGYADEEHLAAAYELGRTALAADITLLDLVRVHHAVVGDLLRTIDPSEVPATVEAAAGFLVEALAPFEIARRAFLEATGAQPISPEPPQAAAPASDQRRSR